MHRFEFSDADGVSAFTAPVCRLVPSDWVRQRGLSLRICAYQEGRITSTDTLLGLVMIPLQNIDEVERSQCSKQQGQTKEFALNFDVRLVTYTGISTFHFPDQACTS